MKKLLAFLFIAGLQFAQAGQIFFNTPPFAGSTALTTAGRQVISTGEVFLPTFNTSEDLFVLDSNVFGSFGVSPQVSFFNGTAATLPAGGLNVIVLRDTDNDNNPATAFNAGSAATLIANALTQDGAGFFIYFNSSLNVNRLVFSTNLNDSSADLQVLARILSPTGQDAINGLSGFTASNFAITDTPEPGSAALMLSGVGLLAFLRSRRRA